MKRELESSYQDPLGSFRIKVPGVILSVIKNVMRTEGVIVEAMLGEGDSLDAYARQLQELEVRRRTAEIERAELVNTIASSGDAEKASAFATMTCPCGGALTATLPTVTPPPSAPGHSSTPAPQ